MSILKGINFGSTRSEHIGQISSVSTILEKNNFLHIFLFEFNVLQKIFSSITS